MIPAERASPVFGLSRNIAWVSSLWVGTILSLILVSVRPFNSDLLWMMQAGSALFERDFYASTGTHYSPVAFLLYQPLTWLGVPASVAAERLVLLVVALAIFPLAVFSTRILHRGNSSVDESRIQTLLVFFGIFVEPGSIFGTPGHLFLACFLPFLLLSLRKVDGVFFPAAWARTAGVLAGLGIWLVPECFLILAVVLLGLAAVGGNRKAPEHTALLSALAVGALAILAWQPGFFGRFLTATVSFYAFTFQVPGSFWQNFGISPLALIVGLASHFRDQAKPGGKLLAVAMGATLAVAFLFPNDVGQHLYPIRALGWILLGKSLFELVRGPSTWNTHARGSRFLAVLVVTALVCLTAGDIQEGSRTWMLWEGGVPARFGREFGRELEGRPMMFLSSSHWPGQPVSAYLGGRSVFSESLLGYLPRYYPDGFVPRKPSQMSPTERSLLERVANLIESEQPVVVVIDDRSDKEGFGENRPFDYLTYFKQDARFAEDWQRYSLRAQLGPFRVYQRN